MTHRKWYQFYNVQHRRLNPESFGAGYPHCNRSCLVTKYNTEVCSAGFCRPLSRSGYVVLTFLSLVLHVICNPEACNLTGFNNGLVTSPVQEYTWAVSGLQLIHIGILMILEVCPFFTWAPFNTKRFVKRHWVEVKGTGQSLLRYSLQRIRSKGCVFILI